MQTRNFSYNVLRITKVVCVRVRVFRINNFSLIYRCLLPYNAMQVSLLVSLSIKWYIYLSRDSNPVSHDPETMSWTKHVDQTSASGLYDENDQYNEHILLLLLFVRV